MSWHDLQENDTEKEERTKTLLLRKEEFGKQGRTILVVEGAKDKDNRRKFYEGSNCDRPV